MIETVIADALGVGPDTGRTVLAVLRDHNMDPTVLSVQLAEARAAAEQYRLQRDAANNQCQSQAEIAVRAAIDAAKAAERAEAHFAVTRVVNEALINGNTTSSDVMTQLSAVVAAALSYEQQTLPVD